MIYSSGITLNSSSSSLAPCFVVKSDYFLTFFFVLFAISSVISNLDLIKGESYLAKSRTGEESLDGGKSIGLVFTSN